MKRSTLTIPNDLRFLPMVIGFVQQNATIRGFETKALHQIELATEEAVSNVIRHAFRPEEEAEFDIICEQTPRGLKIVVKDKGIPFDPSVLPEYDPTQADRAEQGLGWHLMQQSMDEVTFHNLGKEGKEIQLIKYLYQEEEISLEEEEKVRVEAKKEPTFAPNSVAFKVRKAKAADAIEITQCAYDAYGYSYKEYAYYPERLIEMNENGGILSAVAITKDEKPKVIAHGALMFEDQGEKIAELGMAFTRAEYQGQGCAKKIIIFLVKEALKKGVRGIFAVATTNHIYSQKAGIKNGGKDCCILLGDAPASRINQNFSAKAERGTRMYSYLNTQLSSYLKLKLRKKKIYAPPQHRRIIEGIYTNLKETVSFQEVDQEALVLPDTAPLLDTHTRPQRQSAKIKVKAYGTGIIQQIQRLVKKLCIDKYEVISLYLNLSDPWTAQLTAEFESMGFLFIGIIPGAKSGDKLVLQYLNNVLINYDEIHLYSDFAKELLAYIKERDPIRKSMEG